MKNRITSDFTVLGAMVRCAVLPVDSLGHTGRSLYEMSDDELVAFARQNRIFEFGMALASESLWRQLVSRETVAPTVARSLRRYLCRAASRATPFGAFAAVAHASVGNKRQLSVAKDAWKVHISVSGDIISRIWNELRCHKEWCRSQRFFINETVVSSKQLVYFVAAEFRNGRNEFSIETVARSAEVDVLMKVTEQAQSWPSLVLSLGAFGDEVLIEAFLLELVTCGFLVSERGLPLCGRPPLEWLVEELTNVPSMAYARDELQRLEGDMNRFMVQLKDEELSMSVCLEASSETSSFFATSTLTSQLELDCHTIGEVEGAALALRKMFGGADPLKRVRDAFRDRYEDQAVPFLEAFGPVGGLMLDLDQVSSQQSWEIATRVGRNIARRFPFDVQCKAGTISLTNDDVGAIAESDGRAGDEFACLATLYDSIDACAYLHAVYPAPASALISRFSVVDDQLRTLVERLHSNPYALEGRNAERVEIVHDLGGRYGNISHRSVSRPTELHIFGHSASGARTLQLRDVRVSLIDNRFRLFDTRDGSEFLPRLSNAHAYDRSRYFSLYRILGLLQHETTPVGVGFSWGELTALPSLPRVKVGSVIVSLRSWDVPRADRRNDELMLRFFEKFDVPSWVTVGVGDSRLAIDIRTRAGREELSRELARSPGARIYEMPELSYGSPLRINGAQTSSEVVIPFVRKAETTGRSVAFRNNQLAKRQVPTASFAYCKLYLDGSLSDEFLSSVLPEIVDRMREELGCIEWFYVRYADPQHHFRLRFRVDKVPAASAFLREAIVAAVSSQLPASVFSRVVVDEYVPEINRYGGAVAHPIAERLFHVDSELALRLWGTSSHVRAVDWEAIVVLSTSALLEALCGSGIVRGELDDDLFGVPSKATRKKWSTDLRDLRFKQDDYRLQNVEHFARVQELLAEFKYQYSRIATDLSSHVLQDETAASVVRSLVHMHYNRVGASPLRRDRERVVLEAAIREIRARVGSATPRRRRKS